MCSVNTCKMWGIFLRLGVLMAIGFSVSESQSNLIEFMEKRQGQRYCGNKLVQMVQLVCGSIYNTPSSKPTTTQSSSLEKKSDAGDDFWMQLLEQPSEGQYYKLPFRSQSSAHRIFKRYPRGIANECCIYKGCTVVEIMTYCGK